MFTELEKYIRETLNTVDTIAPERKSILEKISGFVEKKLHDGQTAELIYVCTHNSRRSHFGQVWGKTAAAWYGIGNVKTWSAGTEATAFHPHAIQALQRAGFRISINNNQLTKNPVYAVSYSDGEQPVLCYSKTYQDGTLPHEGLCSIMTCTDADGNCPYIPGTELRISCPYDDPKAFDGTSLQDEKYNERCRQIAVENMYIFSLMRN